MIRELVDECDCTLELWNFQVLAIPDIGNSAAEGTAQADFVILAMHDKAELLSQTRDWIERWSRLIDHNKPPLVAPLGQPETRRGTVASILDYLRQVADRKGITFYAHTTFYLSTNHKGSHNVFMDSRHAIGSWLRRLGSQPGKRRRRNFCRSVRKTALVNRTNWRPDELALIQPEGISSEGPMTFEETAVFTRPVTYRERS
jgi:hypothetical protein